MHRLQRRLKNIDAFEKERPLLFKEDWKALIRGDDGLIGFDLSKVGIDRHIESHRRRQSIFECQARVKLDWFVQHATRIDQIRITRERDGGERGYAFAGFRQGEAGNYFQRALARYSDQAREMRGFGKCARHVAIDRHPGIHLVVKAIDVSPDVKTPELVFASFVTERLKRNCNLESPTIRRQFAFRFVNNVYTEVGVAALSHDAILLPAHRIPTTPVSFALIVERA